MCMQHSKSFFRSGGQTKVTFGNEMKINKLAPWSVNDLSSAMNWPISCSVAGLAEGLKITKESGIRIFLSHPSLLLFNHHFCERACLGLIARYLKRKGGLQAL